MPFPNPITRSLKCKFFTAKTIPNYHTCPPPAHCVIHQMRHTESKGQNHSLYLVLDWKSKRMSGGLGKKHKDLEVNQAIHLWYIKKYPLVSVIKNHTQPAARHLLQARGGQLLHSSPLTPVGDGWVLKGGFRDSNTQHANFRTDPTVQGAL